MRGNMEKEPGLVKNIRYINYMLFIFGALILFVLMNQAHDVIFFKEKYETLNNRINHEMKKLTELQNITVKCDVQIVNKKSVRPAH
jgi:hypothetical protein